MKSNWASLNIATTAILAPGPEGALGTIRYEMIREGVQECEARILIERALSAGKISGVLAEKCRAMLDQRTFAMLLSLMPNHTYAGLKGRSFSIVWGFRLGDYWFHTSNWQKRSEALFSLAGEVAEKVGIKN